MLRSGSTGAATSSQTAGGTDYRLAGALVRRTDLDVCQEGAVSASGPVTRSFSLQLTYQQCSYIAGMPVAVTVRNVPEDVRDELAARAARSGRSLQEYLLGQLVDLASRPTMEEVIARARARVRQTGTVLDVDSILAARDADRR